MGSNNENFISSYAKMFVAFQGSKELNNLVKKESSDKKLSSTDQIQKARKHHSDVMNQALKVFAAIHDPIKISIKKIDAIEKQRGDIESIIVQLKTIDNGDEKNNKIISDQQNELHAQLIALREIKNELDSTVKKLEKERSDVDKIMQQHETEWKIHQDEYFGKLYAQLEVNGIILTHEKKSELRKCGDNDSDIQDKTKELEKLQIKLPNKISYFSVIAYYAVASSLSSPLKAIDSKAVDNIIKKLSIIEDENKAAIKLKSNQAEKYEKSIETVKQLNELSTKILVPSNDIIDKAKKTLTIASLPSDKVKPNVRG